MNSMVQALTGWFSVPSKKAAAKLPVRLVRQHHRRRGCGSGCGSGHWSGWLLPFAVGPGDGVLRLGCLA